MSILLRDPLKMLCILSLFLMHSKKQTFLSKKQIAKTGFFHSVPSLIYVGMEATFFCQSKQTSFTSHLPRPSRVQKHNSLIVRAAVTKSPDSLSGVTKENNISWKKAESNKLVQEKTVYHDNWFDLLAINYLSKSVQAATGLKNGKSGYEGLVQSARDASLKYSLQEQRELVLQALDHAVPKPIQALIKAVLPNTKFMREYFAAFTTVFFVWLIGPCEVRESEFNGSKEKNVVHMKKCRFLEETDCVGMCTNLCMVPSQTFIKNSLGMSVNMVPNFDDMSCEMIFGQEPPAITDDPAFQQPCYKLCKAKTKHSMKCSS